ncbi:MAG: hypothetical protein J6W59_00605, partial [Bacteroidales bacterium]|nr:hypothetical protein [Bacteroidales bacterium]
MEEADTGPEATHLRCFPSQPDGWAPPAHDGRGRPRLQDLYQLLPKYPRLLRSEGVGEAELKGFRELDE